MQRDIESEAVVSTEYERALEQIREASRVYDAARRQFRAGKIPTKMFLAVQEAYRAEEVAFDAQYAKEAVR